jgi:hypothetical protein
MHERSDGDNMLLWNIGYICTKNFIYNSSKPDKFEMPG